MSESAQEWLDEMQPALVNWIGRGLLNPDPKVAHAAALVAGKMSGMLGEQEAEIREMAVRVIARITEQINPHDWRSKRTAWETCCAVYGNGDPGGSDVYDGLLPGDHGTDRP
jgi:hypothetical protein